MRIGTILFSLALQTGIDLTPFLAQEKRQTYNISNNKLVTVIAEFPDGTPASHAVIYCDGSWQKFKDSRPPNSDAENPHDLPEGGQQFGFHTDMRGAMIFNPNILDDDIRCHVEKNGMIGTGVGWFGDEERIVFRFKLDRMKKLEDE